jgi:L-alanine-DL-glutamate epimerase-like enolase superfamily enzyme
MCSVAQVARQELAKLRKQELWLTADTNEICDSPEYMIELLLKYRERDIRGFQSLLFVEQPCQRDLRRRMHDVRKLAAIKPVLVDEALASLEDFDLAVQLGYSGVALKTCKCQSEQLVIAAKASRLGFLCSVQDLANTGIALVQSVGLAGRLPTVKAVESNSRQFYPASNEPERRVHPGVFRLTDGQIVTRSIAGPGLGYRWQEIDRKFQRQDTPELVRRR